MSATPQWRFHLTVEIVRELHAEAIGRSGWVGVIRSEPAPADERSLAFCSREAVTGR
jgi:hypothetical protein